MRFKIMRFKELANKAWNVTKKVGKTSGKVVFTVTGVLIGTEVVALAATMAQADAVAFATAAKETIKPEKTLAYTRKKGHPFSKKQVSRVSAFTGNIKPYNGAAKPISKKVYSI